MKFHVLRELQPYSLIELQTMFNLCEDDLRSILKTFSLTNISKRLSKDLSKIELEVLLDTYNIDHFNNQIDCNMYLFKYVGIIMINNLFLAIHPKYSKNIYITKRIIIEFLSNLYLLLENINRKNKNLV